MLFVKPGFSLLLRLISVLFLKPCFGLLLRLVFVLFVKLVFMLRLRLVILCFILNIILRNIFAFIKVRVLNLSCLLFFRQKKHLCLHNTTVIAYIFTKPCFQTNINIFVVQLFIIPKVLSENRRLEMLFKVLVICKYRNTYKFKFPTLQFRITRISLPLI